MASTLPAAASTLPSWAVLSPLAVALAVGVAALGVYGMRTAARVCADTTPLEVRAPKTAARLRDAARDLGVGDAHLHAARPGDAAHAHLVPAPGRVCVPVDATAPRRTVAVACHELAHLARDRARPWARAVWVAAVALTAAGGGTVTSAALLDVGAPLSRGVAAAGVLTAASTLLWWRRAEERACDRAAAAVHGIGDAVVRARAAASPRGRGWAVAAAEVAHTHPLTARHLPGGDAAARSADGGALLRLLWARVAAATTWAVLVTTAL